MAGHNKWSQIKHKKAKTDAQKNKQFTKVVKEIMVSVKAGGEDADGNPSLRLAIQKAKAVNMPQENIKRAIAKAAGSKESLNLQECYYEAYGPNSIAILIKALTDNKNRTVSNLKVILNKNGGRLVEMGSVSYLFDKKGYLFFKSGCDLNETMDAVIEAGADDVFPLEDGSIEALCSVSDFEKVKTCFEDKNPYFEQAALLMWPKETIVVADEAKSALFMLFEALEEDDDVQDIFSNMR